MNHSKNNNDPINLAPLSTSPLPTHTPILVYIILTMIFIGFISFSSQWDFRSLGNYRKGVEAGEVWRFLTSMFLHLDLRHFLFNSFALVIFGVKVERYFGHWKFLVIYVLSGLLGNLCSFAFGSALISVGASGAIFGLIGANLIYFYEYKEYLGEFGKDNLGYTIAILVINIFYGLVQPNIDNWAHIGGLLAGSLLAYGMLPSYQIARTQFLRTDLAKIPKIATYVTSIIGAIVVLCLGLLIAGAGIFGADPNDTAKEVKESVIIQAAPPPEDIRLLEQLVEFAYNPGPEPDCIGKIVFAQVEHDNNIPPRHAKWLIVPDPNAEADPNIWIWKNHETNGYEFDKSLTVALNMETMRDEDNNPFWLGLTLQDQKGEVHFDASYNQKGFDGVFIKVDTLNGSDIPGVYADVFTKCKLDEVQEDFQ